MRILYLTVCALGFCGLFAAPGRADTFQLTDGTSVTGDVVSFNEAGLILRLPEDKYSDRVPWAKFSQDDLKRLAQNPKIQPLVEPFMAVTESEQAKKPAVEVKEVSRLEFPARQSLFGALVTSAAGFAVLALLYAANLFAAYEIAIFRARPTAVVMGTAAVLPVLGPIIFLSMPTYAPPAVEAVADAEAAPATYALPGAAPAGAAPAGEAPASETSASGLRIASGHGGESAANLPPAQVFQRGQYTFNRRFMETKFSGYFSMIRRAAEKDLVFTMKTLRGEFVVNRFTRIGANDVHIEVVKGAASHEVMVPFAEIQEIQIKHKDA